MMRLIRKHGEMRQARNRLQAQVRDFLLCFVFLSTRKETAQIPFANRFLLNSNLLGVSNDDVEQTLARYGNISLSITRECQFHRSCELLEEARWKDAVEPSLGQLTQRLDNRLAGCKHERVLYERPIRIFEGHRELSRKNCPNQNSLSRTHCERENVTVIVKR